ncbi:MAG: helix-hairpin-helix domain-containing protein, partial [Thermoleophilaceae bacterium]
MREERSWTQVGAWALAAALVLFGAWKLISPGRGEGAGAPVAVSRPEAAGAGVESRGSTIYVHVAGAVRRPGLYRLPGGSRIAAAIRRAGGPRPHADLAAVNLAARVQDAQQVVVPHAGAASASAGSGPGRAKPGLATATAEQLDQLDGIGPMLAKRIVDYRKAHGGFRSVDELKQVEGIG